MAALDVFEWLREQFAADLAYADQLEGGDPGGAAEVRALVAAHDEILRVCAAQSSKDVPVGPGMSMERMIDVSIARLTSQQVFRALLSAYQYRPGYDEVSLEVRASNVEIHLRAVDDD